MPFTEALLGLTAVPCLLLVDMGYREIGHVFRQWFRTTVYGELPMEDCDARTLAKVSREYFRPYNG